MKGVIPSNLPNEIAIRKFKLGNMIEDFFKIVLFQVGLLHKQEERVMSNFKDTLQVSGRCDVVYGGSIKVKDVDLFLEQYSFLSFIGILSDAIKNFISTTTQKKFDLCGIEIKSCSDYIFNVIDAENKGQAHHLMQTFHYAYTQKMPYQLVYFDKNNARMKSFWVMPDDKELLKLYIEDISQMTKLYNSNTVPSKELLLKYNGTRFSKNWNVEYSKYLTHSYGFNTKLEYNDYATSLVAKFNRVLERIKKGDKMTANNIDVLREIKKMGFDIGIELNHTEDVPHEVVDESKPKKPKLIKEPNSALDKLKNIL